MKNLIIRALTGIVFVAVMVGGILYNPLTCSALFALITVLSVWEFTGLVNTRPDVHVNRFITTAAAFCLYAAVAGLAAGSALSFVLFVPWLLSVVYLLVSELYLQRESPLNNWAYSMLAQLYVALPFSLLNLFVFRSVTDGADTSGLWMVMSIFIFLWCSDTGAYCTGSLIGRHKLFPRVSPGKTWEGSIGGGVAALLASQVIVWLGPAETTGAGAAAVYGLTALQWAGFALVVVVFGTWGDLVESLLKRQLGVKDSGNILPGHGGMLDRFDSSLLAIPASLIYYCTLALV